MTKAAKDNDRLRVQWVIIMSYATFQFCYGGVETLPWEAKACLLSIKTLHRAQCEHITRTFFSPFQQGEKKKETTNKKKKHCCAIRTLQHLWKTCTSHTIPASQTIVPVSHTLIHAVSTLSHCLSFAIRKALSSHVGSKCLFLTLWLLQMWHSHAQSLCHPESPAVKLLSNAHRRKASWQHLIMPSNDALGRTG